MVILFSAFEPTSQQKIPPKQVYAILPSSPYPLKKVHKTYQPVVNN